MTNQTTDTLTALRDLVAAVTPLVDPEADVVSAYGSTWEIDQHAPSRPDGEELHEALAKAWAPAVAAVEREKDHPPCDATTTYWPDVEAIAVRCVLPVGHWPFAVHRDEFGDDWDEERLTTTGGWGPR